jgi:hypothetical protein
VIKVNIKKSNVKYLRTKGESSSASSNLRFHMYVIFTTNYFSMVVDVLVDSETTLMMVTL